MARRANKVKAARSFFRTLSRSGITAPIYVVTGDESFLVDEAIDRLIAKLFPDGRDEMNSEQLRGGDVDAEQIVSTARMVPMFVTHRLVVVHDADRIRARGWDRIVDYADNAVDSTLLILTATSLDRRRKGIKKMMAHENVVAVDFPQLGERDVQRWIGRRANERGLQIERDVPGYLVEAVGTSLQLLDRELEKLDIYLGRGEAGPRRVDLAVAEEVCADVRTRSVFELADAIGSRDLESALVFLRRMLTHGESPVGIVAIVARHFRILLRLQDGARRGLSGGQLASYAGLPPFRLDQYVASARRFRPSELRWALDQILTADHALKSSRLADRLLVERLILNLCRSDRVSGTARGG